MSEVRNEKIEEIEKVVCSHVELTAEIVDLLKIMTKNTKGSAGLIERIIKSIYRLHFAFIIILLLVFRNEVGLLFTAGLEFWNGLSDTWQTTWVMLTVPTVVGWFGHVWWDKWKKQNVE